MLRGRRDKVPGKKDNLTLMASIHNRFDIEVVDAKTGKVKQRAKAENVILNNAWSYLSGGWFSYVQYGSGEGVPSVSDTALFRYAGYASLGSAEYDTSHFADGYISCTKRTQLSETVAVGVNITEIGIARDDGNGTNYLMTHAMLQDMNGNPLGILKTNTDIINLYATVFIHWDVEGYSGYIDIIPSTSLVGFAGNGVNSSMTTTFLKGKGSGRSPSSSNTSKAYNSATRTFTFTVSRMSITQGNDYGGFCYANFGGMFIVKIPGPFSVMGEAVGTGDGYTKDFATKFDFPENAVVYVDGVPVSNVTVSNEPLAYNDMGKYFYALNEASTPELLVYRNGSLPEAGNNTGNYPSFGHGLFYNPHHDKWGIDTYSRATEQSLEASNDLINWEYVYERTLGINRPISEFRNYKFWRESNYSSSYSSSYWSALRSNDLTGKNIHFAEPPAVGSVITIDYDTPDVPKDANHVYDCSLKVQVGAYTE